MKKAGLKIAMGASLGVLIALLFCCTFYPPYRPWQLLDWHRIGVMAEPAGVSLTWAERSVIIYTSVWGVGPAGAYPQWESPAAFIPLAEATDPGFWWNRDDGLIDRRRWGFRYYRSSPERELGIDFVRYEVNCQFRFPLPLLLVTSCLLPAAWALRRGARVLRRRLEERRRGFPVIVEARLQVPSPGVPGEGEKAHSAR